MVNRKKSINFLFSEKHKNYIRACTNNMYNIAEGAVRAGKTVDNVFAFAHELKTTTDKIHLATGSTAANAKLNIGDCNGMGLEYIFRGQCKWGKYKGNDCLKIKGPDTRNKLRIVIFAGGMLANSYKKIRGNSYGMWIATEINNHHEDTIKEAFNRTIAANKRKIFWDLNPDNPNADIYTKYIDLYDKKNKEHTLLGGYNYMHCTLDDNINIPEQRKEEIKSQYDPNSIWYLRDILGKRCIAEGLIYSNFANAVQQINNTQYEISLKEAKKKDYMEIIIGIDFGGSGSGHAFIATGITHGYKDVDVLKSMRLIGDNGPEDLGNKFVDFCKSILYNFKFITKIYADSAEQTLIRGLNNSLIKAKLLNLKVRNALKTTINNRIRCVDILIQQCRLHYIKNECESWETAMCSCVWDSKVKTEDVRLDDGSSDIDSMDAFEYCIERDIRKLIRVVA